MQYLGHIASDYAVRFVLVYPGVLNIGAMRKAVAYLIDAVPVLHSSFVPENKPYWVVNRGYSPGDTVHHIPVAPFVDLLSEADCQALKNAPFDGVFQIRCTVLDNGSQSVFVLAVSHIVADGGDAKYLLKKILELYNCFLSGGDPEKVAIKKGSRDILQAFDNVDPKVLERRTDKNVGDNVSKVRMSFTFPDPLDVGQPRILRRSLTAEALRLPRAKGKACGAAVNDLLLAAYYRSIRKLMEMGEDAPLAITSTIDLRQFMRSGESEGICNLSSLMPTKLPQGTGSTFQETLRRVVEQTNNVKNNGMAGIHNVKLVRRMVSLIFSLPLNLLTKVGRASGGIAISLTNLGNLSSGDLTAGDMVPSYGYFAGQVKQKPCIQIGVMSIDGNLSMTIATVCGDQDADVMTRVMDGIREELEAFGGEA